MGGQDGNRGYLVQTIIALLDSLHDTAWESVRIEPDQNSPKVDILWERSAAKKATQVKSSINQIGKAAAEHWASELRSGTAADDYELVLVGPCAQSVVEMGSFQGVSIRPKNLDLGGLLDECAHKLDRFIDAEGLERRSAMQRELIVNAMTTHLSALSAHSNALSRIEFIRLLKGWIDAISPVSAPDRESAQSGAVNVNQTMISSPGGIQVVGDIVINAERQLIQFVALRVVIQTSTTPSAITPEETDMGLRSVVALFTRSGRRVRFLTNFQLTDQQLTPTLRQVAFDYSPEHHQSAA